MQSNNKHTADPRPMFFSTIPEKAKTFKVNLDQLFLLELQMKARQIERNYPKGYQGL